MEDQSSAEEEEEEEEEEERRTSAKTRTAYSCIQIIKVHNWNGSSFVYGCLRMSRKVIVNQFMRLKSTIKCNIPMEFYSLVLEQILYVHSKVIHQSFCFLDSNLQIRYKYE